MTHHPAALSDPPDLTSILTDQEQVMTSPNITCAEKRDTLGLCTWSVEAMP